MSNNVKNVAVMDRRYFGWLGIGLFLIAFVGFSRSFYLDPILPDVPAPGQPFYYWVHGPVFTLWMMLIAVQPWLIGRADYQLHKKLGVAGLAIAVLVVATGIWGALLLASGQAQMMQTGLPPKQGWATPVTSMATFMLFTAIGFIWRGNKAIHKRAVMFATIGMMGAPLARWPIIGDWPPTYTRFVLEIIAVTMLLHDWRSQRKILPTTLLGIVILVGAHRYLKPMFWKSEGWMDFTDWAIKAVGLS